MTISTPRVGRVLTAMAAALVAMTYATGALAVQPTVKTVPWVPNNALIPHSTWSGKEITLKGTVDVPDPNFEYTWDFGDGSPVVTATVVNNYVLEARHTYTGSEGDIFTARLTVEDTSTGETDSEIYLVQIQAFNLETEVNVAIDEGLWYLHKTMIRFDNADGAFGDWSQGTSCFSPSFTSCASSGNQSNWANNASAFLVNGHLETGLDSNPYTETVQRALRRHFTQYTIQAASTSETNPLGTFNPDVDGNGVSVRGSGIDPFYQGGMMLDVIVATGTPDKLVEVAPFAGRTDGTGPGGAWTYFDVVQNMVDYFADCQYDFGNIDGTNAGGGWRYNCENFPDGSANQWVAIGIIAAEREFGVQVPQIVKDWNIPWIDFAHNAATGESGYTNQNSVWGPYATTPSGLVQMAMVGIGRGNSLWDTSETFMADRWCNAGTSATNNVKEYFYGLFSFTKSMLLHDPDGNLSSNTIDCLESQTAGTEPTDWYGAEAGQPDELCAAGAAAPCDGVARALVNKQNVAGAWYGEDFSGSQFSFETGWAIIMLNRTVFDTGQPVAVADAVPNPAVAGQTINLDGSNSFHQDPARSIVQWQWDLDNDGQYDDAVGVNASVSFGVVGNYPVGLRVLDDDTPPKADTTTVTVLVTTPPVAPTAEAGGPYVFCPQNQPWRLDGTGSINPDEGGSEPGQPGDTIQSYEWELTNDGGFDDASGAQPDVTAFYSGLGLGDYLVQLRVTDTTATSYPSSGMGDLSDTDSSTVSVKDENDDACACIDDLTARAKRKKIGLRWTDTGAASYNVYRSTIEGGPYSLIGNTTSTWSIYIDRDIAADTTYYYVVREVNAAGDELCQSVEASATSSPRGGIFTRSR